MIKKLLFAGAIVAVLSLMGYGVYEAVGGTGTETHAGIEAGRYAAAAAAGEPADGLGRGQSQGQGGGRRATEARPEGGQAGGGRQGLAIDPAVPDRGQDRAAMLLAGTVVQLDGSELVLQTSEGEQIAAGLGKPSYWESLGITLQAGDPVEITGFWEDGEFEVLTLTATATAQTAVLRDESGRPLWAGGGRWAAPAAGGSSQSF
jgi:hypothetical protein